MKPFMTAAMAVMMLFSQAAAAQDDSVIYQNNTLHIPLGAVIEEGRSTVYRDIRLEEQADGSFVITNLDEALLASVESVNAIVDTGNPNTVNVVVGGNKSVACVSVMEPVISRDDNDFSVLLAESDPETDVCILVITPFEKVVTLDVTGLPTGEYSVTVNNEVTDVFDL